MYPIVNAVTKAWIQGKYLTVLLMMDYSTLLDDTDEKQSLAVTFEMMKNGEAFNMTASNMGGDEGLLC